MTTKTTDDLKENIFHGVHTVKYTQIFLKQETKRPKVYLTLLKLKFLFNKRCLEKILAIYVCISVPIYKKE